MDLSSRRTDHGRGAAVPGGLRGGDTGLGGVCYKNFRVGVGDTRLLCMLGDLPWQLVRQSNQKRGQELPCLSPTPLGSP